MAILDLQLPCHWVWVLQMGSSYNVMVLQREMWKQKFQHWSTTTGRFMNDSITTLHMIVIAQLFIYLPSLFMIDLPHIREPNMPQICSQPTSLLPLKTLLVPWPILLILQIYFLLMILILYMFWRKMWIWKVESTEDSVVWNMAKKDATKRQGSIAPHALMNTINFIIVMVFPRLV